MFVVGGISNTKVPRQVFDWLGLRMICFQFGYQFVFLKSSATSPVKAWGWSGHDALRGRASCHMRRRIHAIWGGGYMSYEEEDTCHMRRRIHVESSMAQGLDTRQKNLRSQPIFVFVFLDIFFWRLVSDNRISFLTLKTLWPSVLTRGRCVLECVLLL